MNALLIPELKPLRHQPGSGHLLGALHLSQQETELLPELVERLEPVVSAVLVSVADEEALEELVDVL